MPRTDQWDQVLENGEELILRNTYLNARLGNNTDYHLANDEPQPSAVIRWEETNTDSGNQKSKNKTLDAGFVVIKSCLKGCEKKEIKVPIVNLENIKEKSMYSRFNFGKGVKNDANETNKIRSSSLNRNDNRLVKEAINAARGLIENDGPKGKNILKVTGTSKSLKKNNKEDPGLKIPRPTTAPQKRASSPKNPDARAKTFNPLKGVSFGNLKKK